MLTVTSPTNQFRKDFEEEPELLSQIDELFNGQEFAVYKSTILQPLINRVCLI